jgi:hexulose-6-phosphate isomerase
MIHESSRRDFLKISAAAAAAPLAVALGSVKGTAAPAAGHMKKALQISMLPKELSWADRFKLVRTVGFDAVEGQTVTDEHEAEEIKKAADDAKVRIHSVMNMAHWENPLTSADPAVVERSLEGMRTSLKNAKLWGADAVLLVPGVVNPQTSYSVAWTRSQEQIKKLIPMAEELKVVIAIEEVWNKFLLSPLEMRTFVDEFKSPWVKSYFDVGNVVFYGYPQDWIHTLKKRIAKVHLKDFKTGGPGFGDSYHFVNLGEGDIDWAAVHQAFVDVGYTGYVTTELATGDEAYLRDVGKRVDRLVLGLSS